MDAAGDELVYDGLYNRVLKKEKSHVVDNHRNFGSAVVARLFRSEHKPELPANRQLDPYFDRYRCHTRRFEPVGDHVNPRFVENMKGQPDRLPLHTQCKRGESS
jgi:hypothetical protein